MGLVFNDLDIGWDAVRNIATMGAADAETKVRVRCAVSRAALEQNLGAVITGAGAVKSVVKANLQRLQTAAQQKYRPGDTAVLVTGAEL